jgi:hypothetical protein
LFSRKFNVTVKYFSFILVIIKCREKWTSLCGYFVRILQKCYAGKLLALGSVTLGPLLWTVVIPWPTAAFTEFSCRYLIYNPLKTDIYIDYRPISDCTRWKPVFPL